jgi:hypothetical protein
MLEIYCNYLLSFGFNNTDYKYRPTLRNCNAYFNITILQVRYASIPLSG